MLLHTTSNIRKVYWKAFNSHIVFCLFFLYCTVLYCTVLYCTVLYCTVLYCTVLYWIVPLVLYSTVFWPHETSPGYSREESRNRIFRADAKRFYVENGNRKQLHLLNVCHSGRSALCRSLPSQLGIGLSQ